ncbi:hypothetical protein HMN09_00429300 [Mycena chlorophos]|uniref:Uncharacterized protein n=1 Tax=Mycena chlorophos TaxID=658473 RepID=A0A8H6TG77_MYCCL|nr:hypothetical protein HMN09_00429300 [Mycena chlorophos]
MKFTVILALLVVAVYAAPEPVKVELPQRTVEEEPSRVGAFAAILYGLQLSLYFQSVYYLKIGMNKDTRKANAFYIVFSTVLLILLTLATAANLWFGEAIWIEHRDVEGGPMAYFSEASERNIAAFYNTLGTAADVTANVLGDGLMLARCFMFWKHMKVVMIIPTLVYLGSVAMGITTTIQSGLPNGDLFKGVTVNFGISWLSLTITFNILVTAMIVGRLLWLQNKMSSVLSIEVSKRYTGLLAVLVESALPFTLLGVAYLALYVRDLPESLALGDIWGTFVVISPQLIILRVAMGAGWTQNAFERISTGMELGALEREPEEDHNTPAESQSKVSHPSLQV